MSKTLNTMIIKDTYTYRILGILFLGLTLSRGISGEPDIPRDKVSPKDKMSNILFIGNL